MKKKVWLTTLLFCILLLLLSACSENEDFSYEPIDGDVLLTVSVVENDSTRVLSILGATETVFSCSNFDLDIDKEVKNGELKIRYKQVIKHSICSRATGPAMYSWNLGNVAPGEYPIEVKVDKDKSLGTLVVSQSEAYLKFDTPKRIQLP